ncbi:hypothetical protein BGZ70_001974 [Mortierella alpina]|uniref:Uncharacterized protein n=1 Tax=Mortierella alpina TaxID=64518 RepID=A0A9P6IVC3_MORAP|nr:hypothetical protein BGZ70_001974 [Mortierella alpina]
MRIIMFATLATALAFTTSPSGLSLHNTTCWVNIFGSHIDALDVHAPHPFVLIPSLALVPSALPAPATSHWTTGTESCQDTSNASGPTVNAKAATVAAKAGAAAPVAAEAPQRHLAPETLSHAQPSAMLMIEGPKFSGFDFSPEPCGTLSSKEPLVINGHRIVLPPKKTANSLDAEHQDQSEYRDEGNLSHTARTASSVWDCSIVLGKYLEALSAKSPGYWNGKRVLELGAGQGIASFSAAALGAEQVIITDIDSAIAGLQEGVTMNGFRALQVQVAALDWTNRVEALQNIQRNLLGRSSSTDRHSHLDYILASDVIWVDYLIPALVDTVADLIQGSTESPPPVFLLAYQFRSTRSDQILFESLDRLKLSRKRVYLDGSDTNDLDAVSLDPKFRMVNIAIWKIWKEV